MATLVVLSKTTENIGADEYKIVDVVDGQQRLTTIIILLKAIEKNIDSKKSDASKIKRELNELLVKDDQYSLVLLQTNHDSSNIFSTYIKHGKIDRDAAKIKADKNIVDAATECEAFVTEWLKDKTVIDLVSIIRNKLSLIYHEVQNEETVFRVFEVLNSRGLPVKWIDKLKSQLMALIYEHLNNQTQQTAHKAMCMIWCDIYRILGLEKDFGSETLRFCGTFAFKNPPKRLANEETSYHNLLNNAGTEIASILKVGQDLKKMIEILSKLHQNARLSAVSDIIHARFVAASILLREFKEADEQKLLGLWEKVTFRIFGLGRADSRHKVGEYVSLGYRIICNTISVDEIEISLNSLSTDRPIDEILANEENWKDCYNNWSNALRYLLYRYDEQLAKNFGIKLNDNEWNKIWISDASTTFEHIQPQSSADEYIHEIGHLTMLPPGINSSLKDKPPVDKAFSYEQTGLIATRNVAKMINMSEGWNSKDVAIRSKDIKEFIREEWG